MTNRIGGYAYLKQFDKEGMGPASKDFTYTGNHPPYRNKDE